jgi:hypothetical protein
MVESTSEAPMGEQAVSVAVMVRPLIAHELVGTLLVVNRLML